MQGFEEGKIYNGFILIKTEFMKDMNSEMMSFVHEKTGAKLTAVKNDDDNKTFCIAFKTIPEDSTGVAHILEHCVLSGSEKYPVKDVFSELYKGGLSTFMNALTSNDSTYYPYSTRNLKEYYNFMGVYLDTTLRPLLTRHSFDQEGWHYELSGKNSPLQYQGIVFNEMKGAMSNPVRQLVTNISRTLFPGSTYSFNSGGDPEQITNLSYEYLINFHKRFYHPSNSQIYVYGNADINDELAFINDNYLKDYEKTEIDSAIIAGKEISPLACDTYHYPISPSEEIEKKTYIAVATKVGTPNDVELNIALHLITNILLNSDASPLKQEIMKAGIAGDFSGYFDDGQHETAVTAYISGSEPDFKDKFIEIYFNSLKELIEKGIDKDLIMSEINHLEFNQKEKEISSMRGLIYLNRVLHLTLYDIDLFKNMNLNPVIAGIRKKALESDYLENVIKDYLINKNRIAMVVMQPDRELSDKKMKNEKEKLEQYKRSLSNEQIEKLIRETQEFKNTQDAGNSEESLAKIPKLEINDIDRRAVLTVPNIEKIDGVKFYSNELFTNDIIYLSLGFDLGKIPVEFLPYLNVFTDLFKEVGTKNRSYDDLFKEISTYFGGFDFTLTIIDDFKNKEIFKPILYIEIRTLKKFLFKAADILTDLIKNITYENIERIKEIITSRYQYRDVNLKSEGYNYSATRLKAYGNDRGKFLETASGLTAFSKYKELYDNPENYLESTIEKVKELSELIFNKNNLHVGIVSDEDGIKLSKIVSKDIISCLNDKQIPTPVIKYPEFNKNEAFLTSADVVFNSLGGNFYQNGVEYSGKLEVLKNYLSSDYLFEMVRLKGGAYGAWIYFNQYSGFMSLTSYRDPNVKKTFEAYYGVVEHLKNFNMSDSSFTNIKIGAYASFDPLLSPYS
ncbi:MAG: insulinase family protein, partial [Candidatus Delongbacteria bacterium]|nr:insulinase family protein [Candidatus Delongbacteria bacterium]